MQAGHQAVVDALRGGEHTSPIGSRVLARIRSLQLEAVPVVDLVPDSCCAGPSIACVALRVRPQINDHLFLALKRSAGRPQSSPSSAIVFSRVHAGGASHSQTEQSRNMHMLWSCHKRHSEHRLTRKCPKNGVATIRLSKEWTVWLFVSSSSWKEQQQSDTLPTGQPHCGATSGGTAPSCDGRPWSADSGGPS
mmetsp:Transcript_111276/g.359031  ORF Transcript_111276/g.359031 Transcript_111276/m.359031 type:complete len:193 (-) Transcript_111276:98-676(-)